MAIRVGPPKPQAWAVVLGVARPDSSATATRMELPCRIGPENPAVSGTRHLPPWPHGTTYTIERSSLKRPFAEVAESLRLLRAERQHWERAGGFRPTTSRGGNLPDGPASFDNRLSAYHALVVGALIVENGLDSRDPARLAAPGQGQDQRGRQRVNLGLAARDADREPSGFD